MKKSIQLIIFLIVIGYIAFIAFQFSDSDKALPSIVPNANVTLEKLPDFSLYQDVKEKKSAFFDTLYPIIEEENKHILSIREALIKLDTVPVEELSPGQLEWLNELAAYYRIDTEFVDKESFAKLLERVDFVPPSLALTQAAIESGWGSSRFSKEGNNIFGQWCFSKGCGMVPSSRDSGKDHEVAEFETINNAVRSYIRNLNTNHFYDPLRKQRAQLRQNDQSITGLALAPSLLKYSEEGAHYVEKVNKFIKHNELHQYNERFHESLAPQNTEEETAY